MVLLAVLLLLQPLHAVRVFHPEADEKLAPTVDEMLTPTDVDASAFVGMEDVAEDVGTDDVGEEVDLGINCNHGVIDVDSWCPRAVGVHKIGPENVPKCPTTMINGRPRKVGYPHGRSCSWPKGTPPQISFNNDFQRLYKVYIAKRNPFLGGHLSVHKARLIVHKKC